MDLEEEDLSELSESEEQRLEIREADQDLEEILGHQIDQLQVQEEEEEEGGTEVGDRLLPIKDGEIVVLDLTHRKIATPRMETEPLVATLDHSHQNVNRADLDLVPLLAPCLVLLLPQLVIVHVLSLPLPRRLQTVLATNRMQQNEERLRLI